jgi:tol-pal system protein YbgF
MTQKTLVIVLLSLIFTFAISQRYGESDDFSYALKLYNEGFYDIAAQQLNLFVDRYPNSERIPDAKYYLGLSLFNSEDFENSRIEFQSLAVTFPDHKRSPEAWQKVGESYAKLGKWEEAARALETVKILYPGDPQAPVSLFKAAELYYQHDFLEKAELTLRDFIDRYPDSNYFPNARLLYANILLAKQNYDLAYKEYQKVLSTGADESLQAQAHLGLGQFYTQLGQIERAKEEYQIILSKFSSTSSRLKALLLYSNLLAISGEYDEAAELINNQLMSFKMQQQKTQLYLQLAGIYYLQENYFSATKLLDAITSTGLNDTLQIRLLFYEGINYLKDKKYQKSISEFTDLLERLEQNNAKDSYYSEAQKNLGYVYLNSGDFEKGSEILRSFTREFPKDPSVAKIYSDLFYAALAKSRTEAASQLYRELLSKAPDYSQRDLLLFRMAQYFYRNRNYNKAQSTWLEFKNDYYCSAKADSTDMYLKLLSKYYIVDQSEGMNKLASLVGRVLSDQNTQNLKLDLARVYLLYLNDMNQAVEMSEEIIKTSTDSSITGEAYHILAEAYKRKAELERFEGRNDQLFRQQGVSAFRNAMNYIGHVNYPDSLAFAFIAETGAVENIPAEKVIQYWEHFSSSYPESPRSEVANYILAKLYYDAGDTNTALNKLQALKESSDRNLAGEAYYLIGTINYKLEDYENASQALKQFLLGIEIHSLRANAFGLLAKIYEKQGDYDLAAQFWARLREKYDYSPAATAAKTRIPEVFLIAGKYDEVIQYTRGAIRELDKSDLLLRDLQFLSEPEFYFYNGKAKYMAADFPESRKVLLDYLFSQSKGKNVEETLFLLAEIAVKEGDSDAALLHLQALAKNDASPFFLQATAKTADIYFEREDFAKAQVLYNKLVPQVTDPEQKVLYQAQEMICMINQGNLKQYDSRLSNFRKTAKKDPHYKDYLASFEFEIGKYMYSNKNFDAAIGRFETVTGKYKGTIYADDAEYYLGLTYTTLNKVDKAMTILSQFSEKYPQSTLKSNIYITLGGLYYRAEKPDLAVGSFKKAVESANDAETRKQALANLILLYRDLGLWDGVLSQARIYVEEFSDAEDIIDKKILIGSALIQLNRYSDAVDYLKDLKFSANSEQEPEIQFYIGEAYFNAGQYENAIREFVKIPLLSKQTKLQWEASALYYSGQAYEKMGRRGDAIRMYQEIIDRPGILVDLKKEAQKRINQLKETG